jgi:hypothetical protein
MSGYVPRPNPLAFLNLPQPDDQPPQGRQNPLTPPWAYANNPVGTETTQGMGMPQGPFNQVQWVRPDGTPVTAGDMAHAHGQVQTAMDVAPTIALGMVGDAPGAFAKWFGKSKIVDEGGQPLTLYHGSGNDIPQFDTAKAGTSTGNVTTPWGTFFTPSPGEASRYAMDFHSSGQNVTPVHLAIENPYEMTRGEWDKHAMTVFRGQKTQDEAMASARDFKQTLQDAGHDGIIIKGRGFNNEYVAFDPTQIKSAIGNRGTYDPNDPRINYGIAGLGLGLGAAATQAPQH